jgi:hypothetical protein
VSLKRSGGLAVQIGHPGEGLDRVEGGVIIQPDTEKKNLAILIQGLGVGAIPSHVSHGNGASTPNRTWLVSEVAARSFGSTAATAP